MLFIIKNVHAKEDETFIMEKKAHQSKIPVYQSGIPVWWENLFSYEPILIFQ